MRSYVDLHLLNQRLPSLVYLDKPKFSFGPCHRQLFTYEVQKFLDKEMDRLILDTVLPPLLTPQGGLEMAKIHSGIFHMYPTLGKELFSLLVTSV